MVASEIQEDGDVEHDAVDAPLDECVAGDLHRACRHALLSHRGEERVQRGRLRRREGRTYRPAGYPGADRADDRWCVTGGDQGGLGEPGDRRLALRTGDADRQHRRGRLLVHQRGKVAECRARCLDHQHGYGRLSDDLGTVRIGQDRCNARFDGVGRIPRAMRTSAGQRGIQVSGCDGIRGEADSRHLPRNRGQVERRADRAQRHRLDATRPATRQVCGLRGHRLPSCGRGAVLRGCHSPSARAYRHQYNGVRGVREPVGATP